MAYDRFVFWERDRPSKEDLQCILEDYLGEAGRVQWDKDRFFATLSGKGSFPFRRLKDGLGIEPPEERWFEIYVHEDSIDIITRQADEYTNVVAGGFAQLVVHFYQARMGEG